MTKRAKSSAGAAIGCFMQGDQPKYLTKDELRSVAMRELNVSKNSFDFGWIDAIETSGRHDWYEPLRKRTRTKN